jgi:protein-S-isoprenylcysteine O-methyltransferase Ste14
MNRPPPYFYLGAVVSVVMHLYFPIHVFGRSLIFGLGFVAFGSWLSYSTHTLMKKNLGNFEWEKVPKHMITSGPYRFSRNPMYLGGVSLLLGFGLLLGSIGAILPPFFVMYLIDTIFIPTEEKNMEKKFKGNYKKYMSNVRRWF